MSKKRNSCYNFSIFHWNLKSITAHNFARTDLLQAYNTAHQHDIICLSESYLDASVSSDNDNLNNGYKFVRADYPGNVNKVVCVCVYVCVCVCVCVCVYFKESLPLRCLPNFYLKELLFLKFLLAIKDAILFQCTDHLVKHLINLTHLSLVRKNYS